jgi:aminoglycoside phosphotransferase family enzyme/predicted kinase
VPSPLPEVIAGLLSRSAYHHPADDIELIQTHVSFVILAGDFAYKIKKQLDLRFLDYSTLERRRRMCEEEVRLNRRLCSDAYLGVSSIVRSDDRFVVDDPGVAVEYAVKMLRMPQDRMLPQLIAHGAATPADIARVARVVAAFHRVAETSDYIASFGGVDTLRTNWHENFEQTDAQIGRTIGVARRDAIRRYVEGFLISNEELIAARAASGRVRDCHGDLRSDSIVVGDDGSVCVMDCIEFSDRIRFGDIASDVAFLAMDLEFRERVDLADEFVAAYLGEMPDETLPLVLDFYRCYRAYVRGKVDSIESEESEVPDGERRAAARRASAYFALADRYATAHYPRAVVMVMGLSGSGKSYIAAALAGRIGAAHVSSDVIRASVVADEVTAPDLPYGAGAYADHVRASVYGELHKRATLHLALGHSVVLDATYMRHDDRVAARRVAEEADVPFLAVEVAASENVIRERMARRDHAATPSDARWHIYVAQRRRLEPPHELGDDELVRVDGGAPLRTCVEAVLARLAFSAAQ